MAKTPLYISKFIKEIKQSILIDEKEKNTWIEQAQTLPKVFVQNFSKFLKARNTLVKKYLEKAIEANPQLITELKNQITKIKINILKLQENEDTGTLNADSLLEENLKKI